MVLPLDETTVVPNGMPAPAVIVAPFTTPVRPNTEVMDELPAVTWPKTVITLVVVAAFDIMMVLVPLTETTVVPVGMPVPEMTWPASTPLMLDTDVMDVLPEVTKPVIELPVVFEAVALADKTIVLTLVTRAGSDITMVVPLDETTVTPDRMPLPAISRPFLTPTRLDTEVMDVLP
jgi:hypothetical protein